VAVQAQRQVELRAHAVGAGDEHGLAEALADLDQCTEAADAGEHFGTQRSIRIRLDSLDELVTHGILDKVPYQEAGQRPRSEYRLTEKGLDLYPVLVAMMEWGDKYAVGSAGPQALLRHRDCGEPVELQLACAAGHVLESAREVTPVPGPGARKIA